jgi:phosphoenolpyruvate carboxykinase (diphosphate)
LPSTREYRLFQRPDDAVHRGLDKQTEADMSRADNFISNFEPLTNTVAAEMVQRVTEFDKFTRPMRTLLEAAALAENGFTVCSANPRLVNGQPSKNPRYLQIRPDLLNQLSLYVAEQGLRFLRAIPLDRSVYWPVDAVLVGGGTILPNRPPTYARWRFTTQFTIRSCPSCSWISSAR